MMNANHAFICILLILCAVTLFAVTNLGIA